MANNKEHIPMETEGTNGKEPEKGGDDGKKDDPPEKTGNTGINSKVPQKNSGADKKKDAPQKNTENQDQVKNRPPRWNKAGRISRARYRQRQIFRALLDLSHEAYYHEG